MTTVSRPSKPKIFRRVRYVKGKAKEPSNTSERLYTTTVDVDVNLEHAMVSHSP